VSRKESTSFEHSEPLPGGLTRWPRPERRSAGGGGGGQVQQGAQQQQQQQQQQPQQQLANNPEAYVEMTVTLQRHDSGFGFRIVGGTEEGSQVRNHVQFASSKNVTKCSIFSFFS
jgi:hypothetical protein